MKGHLPMIFLIDFPAIAIDTFADSTCLPGR